MRTCPNCGHKTDEWIMAEGLSNKYYFCPKCRNLVYTWGDEMTRRWRKLVDVLAEFLRIPQILNWLEEKRSKK